MQNNYFKSPLKNGVLVMVDPKYRKSEYIDIFNLNIINPKEKGIDKDNITLGDYFKSLESKITNLENENKDLKERINKLIKIIKEINGRGCF